LGTISKTCLTHCLARKKTRLLPVDACGVKMAAFGAFQKKINTVARRRGLPLPGERDEFGWPGRFLFPNVLGPIKAEKQLCFYIGRLRTRRFPDLPLLWASRFFIAVLQGGGVNERDYIQGEFGLASEIIQSRKGAYAPALAMWLVELAAKMRDRRERYLINTEAKRNESKK